MPILHCGQKTTGNETKPNQGEKDMNKATRYFALIKWAEANKDICEGGNCTASDLENMVEVETGIKINWQTLKENLKAFGLAPLVKRDTVSGTVCELTKRINDLETMIGVLSRRCDLVDDLQTQVKTLADALGYPLNPIAGKTRPSEVNGTI